MPMGTYQPPQDIKVQVGDGYRKIKSVYRADQKDVYFLKDGVSDIWGIDKIKAYE